MIPAIRIPCSKARVQEVGEARIQQLLRLAYFMYMDARDEDHFDELFETLLEGENRIVALEVESRFWQSIRE